jgi:hypothetical protein
MVNKLKQILKEMQENGVVLLFVRDPVSKQPSVSLTLLIVSFTLTVLSLLNKVAKLVDGVDIENTLQLLIICASLYFGRSLSKKMNDKE